jgi:hypothetical protein
MTGEVYRLSSPVTPKQPQLALYFYAQDRWAIGSKVTLNLGANMHRQSATLNPGGFCRDAAEGPAAIIFPAQCYKEDAPPVYRALAPRAHLSYDISGRSTTVIKGGYEVTVAGFDLLAQPVGPYLFLAERTVGLGTHHHHLGVQHVDLCS